MATADLGWCIARCRLSSEPNATDIDHELTIVSPSSEDEGPTCIAILGLAAILALRDLIDSEVSNLNQQLELSQQPPKDLSQND
jgi:hypothetical protein